MGATPMQGMTAVDNQQMSGAAPMIPNMNMPPAGMEPVLPMPGAGATLPPPPAPNVDFAAVPPADAAGMPVLPEVQVQPAVTVQPQQPPAEPPVVASGAITNPEDANLTTPADDPAAFKIPGM